MKRKLRWWPAIFCAAAALFVSATPAGASSAGVYFNIRHPDGSWQGFQAPAQPPGTCCWAIGDATDEQDDSTHVDVASSSGLWDNVRYSNGSWQGWQQPPQPPALWAITSLAETGDSQGNIWFVTESQGDLYYDYRLAGGSWGSWTGMAEPENEAPDDLAIAFNDVSYQVQVMAAMGDGTVWHNVYTMSSRSWQGWIKPAQVPGGAVSVSAAGEVSGNVQFIAINNAGAVYHNIRYYDGSWQGWREPPQPHYQSSYYAPGSKVSAAVDGDGNAQFTVSADKLYHIVRYVNGTWQGSWATPAGLDCFDRLAVTTQTYRPGPSDFYFATDC